MLAVLQGGVRPAASDSLWSKGALCGKINNEISCLRPHGLQGQAALMEPIDLEWLGVSWARIDRQAGPRPPATAIGAAPCWRAGFRKDCGWSGLCGALGCSALNPTHPALPLCLATAGCMRLSRRPSPAVRGGLGFWARAVEAGVRGGAGAGCHFLRRQGL